MGELERPLFHIALPRTEPGAGGTEERRPAKRPVAPGAFITILPGSGGPGYVLRPADGSAQGSAGVGQVHPGGRWFWASLLCNCCTASAV